MENRESEALPKGTVLYKYEVEKVLGNRGGTGFTYLAVDHSNQRKVALKEFFPLNLCTRGTYGRLVPPQDKEDLETFENAKRMFEAEAKLLQENKQYGVVLELYDVFHSRNTIYYAMEYLEGQTMGHYLENRGAPLTAQETCDLLESVFDALICLHRMNIWHRDVGPDNIFMCNDGRIRLIDFGNARMGIKGNSRGVDWEKPGYSAYEMQNSSCRQGTWSDVYSLAAVFYRCITGIEPVPAGNRARGANLTAPLDMGCALTQAQEDALMKALEIFPEDRYQNVLEFKQAIYPQSITTPVSRVEPFVMPEHIHYAGMLQCLDGIYSGRSYPIGKGLTLGRRVEDCNIIFPSGTPGVSGVHCRITFQEESGTFFLEDLGSTYGTRNLGGQMLEKHRAVPLREGEGFTIGDDNTFVVVKEFLAAPKI